MHNVSKLNKLRENHPGCSYIGKFLCVFLAFSEFWSSPRSQNKTRGITVRNSCRRQKQHQYIFTDTLALLQQKQEVSLLRVQSVYLRPRWGTACFRIKQNTCVWPFFYVTTAWNCKIKKKKKNSFHSAVPRNRNCLTNWVNGVESLNSEQCDITDHFTRLHCVFRQIAMRLHKDNKQQWLITELWVC